MIPNIDSRLVFLLGKPLRQSFAADLYNRWFEKHGENIFYFPIESPTDEEFERLVLASRSLPLAGMGVTKPYKLKIIPYLDGLEELTRAIGAVNTVVVREGKWIGHNTDGIGAIRSLRSADFKAQGESIMCLGAGGAARSVCFNLAQEGAKRIYITSPSSSAARLADEINLLFSDVAKAVAYESDDMYAAASRCRLVMNMSGVGMGSSEGESPVSADIFNCNQLCFDAIYNPQKTKFLCDAEAAGASILNGYGMFIAQASLQLELWCGSGDVTQELEDLMRRE